MLRAGACLLCWVFLGALVAESFPSPGVPGSLDPWVPSRRISLYLYKGSSDNAPGGVSLWGGVPVVKGQRDRTARSFPLQYLSAGSRSRYVLGQVSRCGRRYQR